MEFLKKTALISDDEKYRFHLSRVWDESKPAVCFMMLNPSTADAEVLDPTLTRCVGFANQWGFGTMHVVNIFAFRATNPKDMMAAVDPIGVDVLAGGLDVSNNGYLTLIPSQCSLTVAGWGIHGVYRDRHKEVAQIMQFRDIKLHCLGKTTSGQPKHPLYLAKNTQLEEWKGTEI